MRELDPLISEYRHEKKRPREAEALLILRKVASLVKPIMRQRAWKVGALCEFYPQQRNLLGLNVNSGQKICLRLRYPSDQRQFLPIEQVLDTMLHELCHNVIGPHNQQFHALWNQLRDEHEELARKGYTGEGFLSQGKRLGGQRIPLDEARRQARAAAEQRRVLTKNSGKKLGGAPVLRGTDIRKLRADAAQRRIEVTQGCASGTDRSTELAEEASHGFRTQAEEDDANERAIMEAFIELIQEEEREKYESSYVPPSQENPAGPRTKSSPPPTASDIPPAISETLPALPKESPPSDGNETVNLTADNSSYEAPWVCPTCTLKNPSTFLCCDVCAAERPPPTSTLSTSTSSRNSTQPVRSEPRISQKRPLPLDQNQEKEANLRSAFVFKNRTRALDTLKSLDRGADKKPLGWVCISCSSFMETQWWTCSCCGTMKPSS
ncbi:Zinc finger RanBP2-type [Penicillium cf. griseofulvum]|uniref:Zinc finger RanBP2-type n=1 Tax=Penicillium cf. griseofulvum TaxID=2972120 RepID=A0A9W9T648_9EURO|nr:Zinc finger RanBP2-type [Penicillium cf. griseofulvum]KAJ5422289.1 Zinc finger RanBP2-type [Penicillium cf. griseofulvum]KAJ5428472.1 Zinc finger RanBP2-type [Penicillium cf. griseofulvum]